MLKVFTRIKLTQDGIDFIEFLKSLSKQNYLAWKKCSSEFNDLFKGQAMAIDSLIEQFATCEQRLREEEERRAREAEEKSSYEAINNPSF